MDTLISLCEENAIGLVVPTIDTELPFLAANADRLAKLGTHVAVSDDQFIRTCQDKRRTHKFFGKRGIKVPRPVSLENVRLPVFSKPADGSSSIGAQVVRTLSQLDSLLSDGLDRMYMAFIDPATHQEYSIDMYFDRSSHLRCAVTRSRIEVRAGEVSKSRTEKDVCDVLTAAMNRVDGARGCVTVQAFRHRESGETTAIEINPRLGGGYPLSYAAGANYPAWLIREYLLGEKIDSFSDWKPGLLMLRYDNEIIA